ncbi:ATP-binding cassette domain-containing protein [Porifericola rhodea]|uniref:ATP-binding cassette domain-containing protein n=1 Tax=Porifericola rhodea TaxID=930972 RepID=UPI002665027E|nr:ATP-binding cassette domain-containing protein [Porifericola rhodea]WKN30354.1 ATP-binding cassette domain-containing protein [Porifericola rhodea]
MIHFKGVETVKSGNKIFENLSWNITEGEHWLISGANGSGKTAFLELIAGKAHIVSGEVQYSFLSKKDWTAYFDGLKASMLYIPAQAVHNLLQKQQGLFYQQRYYASFNEDIPTVREILEPNLKYLQQLDVPHNLSILPFLDLPLTRLSNGQFKKLLICEQLSSRLAHPHTSAKMKLLLLDYPFEGLDAESRQDLCLFLEHIAETQNLQLILTDHHHELPSVINRRLVLENRKIVSVEDLRPTKSTGYTQTLNSQLPTTTNAEYNTVIEMRDVCISYGDKVILNNFNWKVKQGERWVLCGKNGSGKTTLFSLIYADHPMAYSQGVYLFGKRRGSGESIWDIKNQINYLGPEVVSYFNPKAIRDTASNYLLQKNKVTVQQLKELLLFFEVEYFETQAVYQLSLGDLQLMLLMRCLLQEKPLLLLDEPFQFLDPNRKHKVAKYLQHYLDQDKTLILITHYDEDVKHWTEYMMKL